MKWNGQGILLFHIFILPERNVKSQSGITFTVLENGVSLSTFWLFGYNSKTMHF